VNVEGWGGGGGFAFKIARGSVHRKPTNEQIIAKRNDRDLKIEIQGELMGEGLKLRIRGG